MNSLAIAHLVDDPVFESTVTGPDHQTWFTTTVTFADAAGTAHTKTGSRITRRKR